MLPIASPPAPSGECRSVCAPLHLPPAARALLALAPNQCRWPLGEPGDEDFAFCHAPQARRSRYCPDHARRGRLARRG